MHYSLNQGQLFMGFPLDPPLHLTSQSAQEPKPVLLIQFALCFNRSKYLHYVHLKANLCVHREVLRYINFITNESIPQIFVPKIRCKTKVRSRDDSA